MKYLIFQSQSPHGLPGLHGYILLLSLISRTLYELGSAHGKLDVWTGTNLADYM